MTVKLLNVQSNNSRQDGGAVIRCDGCGWYHDAWPKLRAAGAVVSATQHKDFYIRELNRVNTDRVMIAGTSDEAMLSIVSEVSTNDILVVDKCVTPLIRCREYAEEHGFRVKVLLAELDRVTGDDATCIVTDCIFSFIPEEDRDLFVRRMRSLLRKGGHFITVNRLRNIKGEQRFTEREKNILVSKVPENLREAARNFADNFVYYPMDESIVKTFTDNGFEVESLATSGSNTVNSAPSTTGDARRIFMNMRKL